MMLVNWLIEHNEKNNEILKIKKKSNPMFVVVMVNFMCPFEWAMGCPDMWLNIVSGSVCGDVLRLADFPYQCRWVSSNLLRACTKRQRKVEFTLSA